MALNVEFKCTIFSRKSVSFVDTWVAQTKEDVEWGTSGVSQALQLAYSHGPNCVIKMRSKTPDEFRKCEEDASKTGAKSTEHLLT
jgi:hypothetical protein